MTLKMCAYQNEEDYWRIRDFLRQLYRLNGRRELAWQAYRFAYWLGATRATVGSSSPAAGALYGSMGFTE